MSQRERFERVCREACEAEGWELSEGVVTLVFEDGRRQVVDFELFAFEGQELVRLFTTIGSTVRIDPMRLESALRLNFGLPHGALAVKKDNLVMVDTLMAERCDAGEVAAAVRYLGETADHFEKTMFGPDRH